MQKTIDQIRKLIDPKGYLADLETVKAAFESERGKLLINRDLNEIDPQLTPDERKAAVTASEKAIFQAQWRVEEITQWIEDAKDGAMGGRAAKRRRKKAAKKAED